MIKPKSIPELQEAVRSHPRVLAVGARTKPRLSQVDGDDVTLVDMTGLSGITDYDSSEFTFTALAGTPVSVIEETLATKGQYLPFAPLLRGSGATIGGTTAAGFGGPGRFRFGGVRDFFLAINFVDGNGKLITGGGRVVKNTAGFDIPKFMVGSLGRFGILTELTFKVFPSPPSLLTLRVPCGNARAATEKIVAAASSRWELQAIDYVPSDQSVYLRIGGPSQANDEIAGDIEKTWGPSTTRLTPAESETLWEDIRELRWTGDAEVVLKAPITPREIAPLEEALADVPGASAHYSVGGNAVKIALDKAGRAGDLDRALRQLELRGLAFIGTDETPLWFGERAESDIARSIKKVFDPQGRFPEL